jgi:hypothetical protein
MTSQELNNRDRIKALRQIRPKHYHGTDAEIIGVTLCGVFMEEELELPICFYGLDEDDYMSVGFVEKVCKLGYEAVINDGELIAFKKAV